MQFLRRKSDQAQAGQVDAWHPNFRNRERLPDTKVVRTFFFINATAIAVALGLILLLVSQEYAIKDLHQRIASAQGQIAANQKGASEAVLLKGKFAAEEKKIHELDAFLKQRLVVSQFMLHLGSTLPPNLVIDSVDIRDAGVTLRGTAAGANPVEASGRTSAYVDLLHRDAYFKGLFGVKNMTLQDVRVDQNTGRVTFDMLLGFSKPAGK
jgi:Tfp pilus assembly protein PilN